MPSAGAAELVFVVDVSSLTSGGFVGSTQYEGKRIDLDFDDGDSGVFLSSEMAGRLLVKKGSQLSIIVEGDSNLVSETKVASVGKSPRISDAKVYYTIGREGGGVLRLRRGGVRAPPSEPGGPAPGSNARRRISTSLGQEGRGRR